MRKMRSRGTLYILLYFLMVAVHYFIWKNTVSGYNSPFFSYYIFLTAIFMVVIGVLYVVRTLYPQYIGFTFAGLVLFKLGLVLILKKKLHLDAVPDYKFHFIIPYLFTLVLEALFAMNLIARGDINHSDNVEN